MLIINGQSNSFIVFGKLTQSEFHEFMAHMSSTIAKWHNEGCPQSGV